MRHFVKRSGKKVGEETKMLICERTAALVAATNLLYHFVKLESLQALKNIAQAFID